VSEADLVHRARQGDASAWDTLVEQHQEALFRLAYLIVSDPDDAADIAQEAFIRAYRSLHRFDPERALRPWLLSIAGNLARNHRRSIGRYFAALQRLARGEVALHGEANIEELSAQQREAQSLWKAVRRLSEADQQVIYLRHFLDCSVEETAAVLDIAPGTVKSRLHRALARLRGVIEADFPALHAGAAE
jgi:RNA polymerase sigma-70 factor, ECF subfamily